MLPLFHKKSHSLAIDDQFFKYNRFALGEIVLLVIGILIALPINTWNEDGKSEKQTIELLAKDRQDLLSNGNSMRIA